MTSIMPGLSSNRGSDFHQINHLGLREADCKKLVAVFDGRSLLPGLRIVSIVGMGGAFVLSSPLFSLLLDVWSVAPRAHA